MNSILLNNPFFLSSLNINRNNDSFISFIEGKYRRICEKYNLITLEPVGSYKRIQEQVELFLTCNIRPFFRLFTENTPKFIVRLDEKRFIAKIKFETTTLLIHHPTTSFSKGDWEDVFLKKIICVFTPKYKMPPVIRFGAIGKIMGFQEDIEKAQKDNPDFAIFYVWDYCWSVSLDIPKHSIFFNSIPKDLFDIEYFNKGFERIQKLSGITYEYSPNKFIILSYVLVSVDNNPTSLVQIMVNFTPTIDKILSIKDNLIKLENTFIASIFSLGMLISENLTFQLFEDLRENSDFTIPENVNFSDKEVFAQRLETELVIIFKKMYDFQQEHPLAAELPYEIWHNKIEAFIFQK